MQEIRHIQCIFTEEPENSFHLVNDGNTLPKILSYRDSTELENVNQELLQRYLSYFSRVALDEYLADPGIYLADEFCGGLAEFLDPVAAKRPDVTPHAVLR